MTQIRPMLAVAAKDLDALKFPLWASPKLDGIRAIVHDGQLMSRNWKPIPNRHVQRLLGRAELNGLDGELIVGPAISPTVFNTTSSAIMSHGGAPYAVFFVFDHIGDPSLGFQERYVKAAQTVAALPADIKLHVVLLDQSWVTNSNEAQLVENQVLERGYEGLMLRCPKAPYKYGRSTLKQQGLLKVKRFEDAEARVIGFEELMRNTNEAKTNELGLTSRSSSKAGQIGGDTMGALIVEGLNGQFAKVQFAIGTGFDAAQRASLWARRQDLLGQIVKYKYFAIGAMEAPRFPVFLGFRDLADL